jgi:hypothetical protein
VRIELSGSRRERMMDPWMAVGGEFGSEPAGLTNPGDAVADRIKHELCAQFSFGGRVVVGVADDGHAMHGDVCVPFLGREHASREAFKDDFADAEDVILQWGASEGENKRV